jgi:single-strand DNA-binding protein
VARGFARASVVGNLTRDPELRQTPNGASVCQLGVAVGRSYKDASGQWQEETSFFDVVVWGRQGENCAQYLSKGRQVAIDGELRQRSWEAQDGTRRSKVEIVANQVVFMGGGAPEGGSRPGAERSGPGREAGSDITPAGDDFKDIDFGDEDDIPF